MHLTILPRHRCHCLEYPNSLSQSCNYQHQQPPKQKASAPRFESGNRLYTGRCREAKPERIQQTPESNWIENRSTFLGLQIRGRVSPSKPFQNAKSFRSAPRIPLGFAGAFQSAHKHVVTVHFRWKKKKSNKRGFCLVSDKCCKKMIFVSSNA